MSNLDLTKILSKKYKELPGEEGGGGGLQGAEGRGGEKLVWCRLSGSGVGGQQGFRPEGPGVRGVGGSARVEGSPGSALIMHLLGPHTLRCWHC